MDETWKDSLWQQFGASIDMLENALRACPAELWSDRTRQPEAWYLVYHTLFWLDLYLSGAVEDFSPPVPFTLVELDPAGLLPDRVYDKEEMQEYLEHCRRKCRSKLGALTDVEADQIHEFRWGTVTYAELQMYNLRHVQHGAAQLNLILRQVTDSATPWVHRADSSRRRA